MTALESTFSSETLVTVLPLVEDGEEESEGHQTRSDRETLDVSRLVGSGPEEGSVNRSQVSETVDNGNTDSSLFSACLLLSGIAALYTWSQITIYVSLCVK